MKITTDEQWTGKYWSDGKKIYTKKLEGTTIPLNGTAAISNVDMITLQYGMCLESSDEWLMHGRDEFNLILKPSSHEATYYFRLSAGSQHDWWIVCEYTKTTD